MASEFAALTRYLIDQSRNCLRPPVDRFRWPWLAPMPLSRSGAAYLAARQGAESETSLHALARGATGDGFKHGDYSLGLFHHDASEASIELLAHEELREGAAGSLLCLLDCAEPSGLVHRAELSTKSREAEPSKPVLAQYAARVLRALGPEWVDRHRIYPRVLKFVELLEQRYSGLHGLFLTHSALQSGFDSDLLTAGLPDRSVEGPDTNAFMVLEYRALAELAQALGRTADVANHQTKAEELSDLMGRLLWWEDDGGGFYTALRWQHGVGSLEGELVGARDAQGNVQPLESWVSLLPLYAGIPSPERAEALIKRLLDPARYWGPFGVRTLPASSPFFHQAPRVMLFDFKKSERGPVSNWSGPVWVLSNYYLACGLARYGHHAEAKELALKTARLLAGDLARTGMLHESYDDHGNGLWPVQGTFVSWNVLALTMLREHAPEVLA